MSPAAKFSLGWLMVAMLVALAFACGPATEAGVPSESSNANSVSNWVGRTVPSSDGQSMTVQVDPDKTLSAQPGLGVGIFVEYQSGGHWRITWSCDTTLSSQPCAYQVQLTAPSGFANLAAIEVGDQVMQASPQEVQASSVTTTGVDGLTVDLAAGTPITLYAVIGGSTDGIFIFFVENGVINGGYTGALTDPLSLEPSSP